MTPSKKPRRRVRTPAKPKLSGKELAPIRVAQHTPLQCIASKKQCRCGYKYPKGSSWQVMPKCPKCGLPHRCDHKEFMDAAVCVQHGGRGIMVKRSGDTSFRVAAQLSNAYNKIIGNPDLLTLTHNMAVLRAREDDLMRMLETHDSRGAHELTIVALGRLEGFYIEARANKDDKKPRYAMIDLGHLEGIVKSFRDAIEPTRVEAAIWQRIYENYNMQRQFSDTERRYLLLNQNMVPIAHVVEVLVMMERLTYKYVKSVEDRERFILDLRRNLPIEVQAK